MGFFNFFLSKAPLSLAARPSFSTGISLAFSGLDFVFMLALPRRLFEYVVGSSEKGVVPHCFSL